MKVSLLSLQMRMIRSARNADVDCLFCTSIASARQQIHIRTGIECQRQYKAENRAKKEILRANIGQMTFDEIVKNYRSLDRASLIIIKKALTAVLRVIEKKLK